MSRRCAGCATSSRRAPTGGRATAATTARACAAISVSGRVKNPGMKLAPAGITVRELIDEYLRRHGRRPQLPRLPAGRRIRRHPAGLDGRHPARFRHAGEIRLLHRFGRGHHPVRPGQREGRGAEPDALLRGRELRPVHALPGRHPEGGAADGEAGVEPRTARRIEPGDARRLDLRPRPGGLESADDASSNISRTSSARKRRNDRRSSSNSTASRSKPSTARPSGRSQSARAARFRICAIRRNRTTGPTAIAAPAWSRSRASGCWRPPASARRASA